MEKNYLENYRFGVSLETLQKEIDDHYPILRGGCYVPTAKEVHELPPEELREIINDWMWESPSLLIPSNEQIREVIDVIENREDVSRCGQILVACLDYINAEATYSPEAEG